MKQRIKGIMTNPLFSGSLLMIIGSNVTNTINYAYHLIMGRLLGPASYGELVSLISLITILGMIPSALNLPIVKYVSSAKNEQEVGNLAVWLQKRVLIFSLLLLVLVTISATTVSKFLKIENPMLIIFSGVVLFFSLPSISNRSVLHGVLRFKQMLISILAENSTRLVLGVILILWGLSVKGAILGMVVAGFLGWLLAKQFINDYLKKGKEGEINIKPMFLYALPVFVQLLAMTSLYSTDLILVKHFFSSHDSGIYASLSTLGKIIFFGAGPIASVMFAIVSQRHSKGEKYKKVFIYSFIMTFLLSIFILVIYWLFPRFAIETLYGSSYLEAVPLLVYFGILTLFYTLSSLIINFYLSLGKTKIVVIPLVAAVCQIIGIFMYHDSILTVINVSMIVNALLLALLLVYFVNENKTGLSNRTGL